MLNTRLIAWKSLRAPGLGLLACSSTATSAMQKITANTIAMLPTPMPTQQAELERKPIQNERKKALLLITATTMMAKICNETEMS